MSQTGCPNCDRTYDLPTEPGIYRCTVCGREYQISANIAPVIFDTSMRTTYASDQPDIAHHCPNCEAALRTGSSANAPLAHGAEQERDDLLTHPLTCACGDHIGYAQAIGLSQDGAVCGNCAVGRTDYDARTELTTLRALLAAIIQCAGSMRTPPYADAIQSSAYGHGRVDLANELRALIAKTEAK